MTRLNIEFDLRDVRGDLDGAKRAIAKLVDHVAEELSEEAADEARPASRRLGRDWPIENEGADRRVVAPEWWAGFVARGTRDHGPNRDRRLFFELDGRGVFAIRVRGVRPNPFHERARVTVEDRVDRLFGELIEREVR